MASINATTSSGIVATADNTGLLQLQSAGTTVATISSTGLTMNSGNIIQASNAAPAFSANQTTGTLLSAGTTTKVLFDTEQFDTNSNFASSRFTPTVAGYYQMNACVFVSGTVGALLTILNASNGASRSGSITNIANQGQAASMVSSVMYFNGSTDWVEVFVFSSNALTTLTGQYTYFNGCFLRSA
jgi:hypothetical protein